MKINDRARSLLLPPSGYSVPLASKKHTGSFTTY